MPQSSLLHAILTSDLLSAMAGDITFARGLAYARGGRVKELSEQEETLVARVGERKRTPSA